MNARFLLLFIWLFSSSALAAIPECRAVFSNGAQTHASNGSVRFEWKSYIRGNANQVIETKTIYDNSGRATCDGGDCTASGGASATMSYDGLGSYSTALSVGYNTSQSAVPGEYRWINLDSKSTLTLAPGDYLVSGDVHLKSQSKLRVDGSGVVRIIVAGRVQIESQAKVNDNSTADLLVIYAQNRIRLENKAKVTGFLYSENDIELSNKTTVEGAVSGATVQFGSSQSSVEYADSLVDDLQFGDLCGGGGEVAEPPVSDSGSCSAIFSDGVQSHSQSGSVRFYWHSGIDNSPDNMIDTPSITDSSGGRSCGSVACGFTGSPSQAIDFNDYSSGGSNISLGYSERVSHPNGYEISPGTYDNITLGYDTALLLTEGDYYVSGDFDVGTQARVLVTGTVRVFIRGEFVSAHQAEINAGGSAEQLLVVAKTGLTIGNEVTALGFFYSPADVILNNEASVTGALSGKDVTLNSSNGRVSYDSAAVSAAEFGDICGVAAPAATAPIAEYRFDDCSISSSAADAMGAYADARVFGASQSDGVLHKALDLSATSTGDGAQLPSSLFDGLEDFTVMMWVKTSKNKRQQELLHVLGSRTSDDELEMYLYYDDYLVVNVQDRSEFLRTPDAVNDGNWHQLALTRQGGDVCLFVDGQQTACENGLGRSSLSVPNSNAAYLGQEQDAYGGRFSSSQSLEGLIDEFRVFDEVLSDSEIADFYQNESNGLQSDGDSRELPTCEVQLPAARWDFAFDEAEWTGSGYEVTDLVNGNDAQAAGGVTTEAEGAVCRQADFDGYNDNLQVDDLSTVLNSTASMAYWIKTTQQGSSNTWTSPSVAGVEQHGGTNDIFWGRIDNRGRVGVSVGNTSSTVSTSSINDGEWHYVVLSRDSSAGQYQVFVDGVLESSGSIQSGDISLSYTSIGRLEVAGRSTTQGYLNAGLDELVIFDEVLDEEQVALMYNNQLNSMRWNGDVSECDELPVVDHYRITTDSPTLTCDAATISISAYDSANQLIAPTSSTTVSLSFSGSLDGVSLASGSGTWQSSGYQYQFADGETGFTLTAMRSTPTQQSIDIDVSDGLATEPDDGGSYDQPLRFVSTAFKFYADGVDSAIGAQMAGKASDEAPSAQNIVLKALTSDPDTGLCSAFVSGNLDVGFSYSCDDPSSCGLPSGGVELNSVAINEGTLANTTGMVQVPVTFDAQGEAPISFFYKDTGQITLYAESVLTGLVSGTQTVQGESNGFVVKPGGLCLAASGTGDAVCTSLDASCSAFEAAGADFTLSLSSHLWNGGNGVCAQAVTPSFDLTGIPLSLSKIAPTSGASGALAVTDLDVADGEVSTNAQQVSEVGVFSITATPPNYMGEALDAVSLDLGRFYANHFTLDNSSSEITAACTASTVFTYFGQPFTSDYRLQARNAQNEIVQNYRDDFIKLSSSTGNLSLSAWQTSDLSSRLSGASGTVAESSTFAWSAGEGDVVSELVFARASAPDGPFDTMWIGLDVTDADGATIRASDKTLDLDGDTTNDVIGIGQTSLRYGRLNIANTHGPETAALNQPFQTEYYDGSRFSVNDFDSCTSVTALMFGSSFVDDDTSPDDSSAWTSGSLSDITIDAGSSTPSIEVGTLVSGKGRFKYTAPGVGNTGTIYTRVLSESWLQYDWDGDDDYTDNPEASAAFGRYRGHDRLIYWLEGN